MYTAKAYDEFISAFANLNIWLLYESAVYTQALRVTKQWLGIKTACLSQNI